VVFLLRASTAFFSRQTVSSAKTFDLIFPRQNEVNEELRLRLGDQMTQTLIERKQFEMNYEHITEVSTFMEATRNAVAEYQIACEQHKVVPFWDTVKSHIAQHLSNHACALVHMRTVDDAHTAGPN
jgi:O-methyltransferase involved in polyketide biosynthesis